MRYYWPLVSQDARRAVTKVAVREARLKEIKQEMLHSTKLKSYFEDHTRDLQLLRHDKSLHTAHVQVVTSLHFTSLVNLHTSLSSE